MLVYQRTSSFGGLNLITGLRKHFCQDVPQTVLDEIGQTAWIHVTFSSNFAILKWNMIAHSLLISFY